MKTRKQLALTGLILLFSLLFVISSCSTTAAPAAKKTMADANVKLQNGQVIVKKIGNVTFHTYTAMGMVSQIIETPNAIVLQDTVQTAPNNKELIQYIQSLNKPIDRIIVSHDHEHHWVGLTMFNNTPIYATADTINAMRKGGDQALQGLKNRMGDQMIPYPKVVLPSFFINPGEETIDGVSFNFIKPARGYVADVLWTEFPEQNAVILHHLVYLGMHFPAPPIADRVAALEELKAKNYGWVMAGHGMPAGPEFFDQTIEYLETCQKIIDDSPDVKTAKEKIMEAYPTWGGDFLLDMLLPAHYQ